ncbi:nucleoside deaminase [bacterium]|nr:nucleoside deaminase [bacterium]
MCEKDVPVGAVIVKDGEIITSAHNEKEILQDVTGHAEILAIKEAQKKLKTYHLTDCDMYVTLEPCPMCAWAIINSGIKNVYFGAYDLQYGAMGSVLNLPKTANSKIKVYSGIKETECKKILDDFFKKLRK